MLSRFRKGTTDHDGDGRMGGSLPEDLEKRLAKLEQALERCEEVMRRNGWSL